MQSNGEINKETR